jgi:hypothetical protein
MARKRKAARVSDDMHDSEKDLRSYPQLRTVLEECRLIEQRFIEADAAAGVCQSRHKIIVAVAAIFGTLAIILAIAQLTLSHLPNLPPDDEAAIRVWLMASEAVAVVLAAGAVCWGAFGQIHHKWLEQRHRAERYRFVKFAWLINPATLSVDQREVTARSTQLQTAVTEIGGSSAHQWAVEEDPHNRPPNVNDINVSQDSIQALIGYYLQKRLKDQKHYFDRQARRHDKSNWYTRLPPPVLFFVSVFLALLHVLIQAVTSLSHGEGVVGPHEESVVAVILIAAAAILPVCGGGIRTARAAFEFSRHTLRFRAKYNALAKLEESLTLHEEELSVPKATRQGELEIAAAVYGDLWMCEHVLEHEQREWLRLMIEAEWFA